MIDIALNVAFVLIALSLLLCLWRLGRGPDTVDRVLALDTLNINAIGLLLLLGIRHPDAPLFEAALLIAMTGFISTVAFSKYLSRGNIIE